MGKTKKSSPKQMEEKRSPYLGPARYKIAAITLFALLVRVMVSLGPYSGHQKPPMYGDYEAQRHWMEITLHTPISEWYRNTSTNNLSYWGLDYPPLTAYQSYFHGRFFLQPSVPESVALFLSRGFESYNSKLLLRWTVISSDLIVFFPAALYFVLVYFNGRANREKRDGFSSREWLLAIILINPCLILIDHGHFQYNCISLGFMVGAVAAIFSGCDLFGSFLFCLSLNHKQMSAYYAPAFFAHLLGKCLKRRNPIFSVIQLGIVVLGTFSLIWWPYLYSFDAVREVLTRLAPFERGIYEDYVANFWCSTSILIKWKLKFSIKSLKLISACATVISFLPSMIHQIKSPSNRGFLLALLNSSFSFYLFSYQVHEKSILLPLIPASLLAIDEPTAFGWLVFHAMFSMLPLLRRDDLLLQYGALLALFALIYFMPIDEDDDKSPRLPFKMKRLMVPLSFFSAAFHLAYLFLIPPRRYPFLFEAMITNLCFSQFVVLALYFNIKQWTLGVVRVSKKKKL